MKSATCLVANGQLFQLRTYVEYIENMFTQSKKRELRTKEKTNNKSVQIFNVFAV